MAMRTKISWCDATFNPWIGCTKISPGCKNCYAETLMDHRYKKVQWGPTGTRIRTSKKNWKEPIKWNKKAEQLGTKLNVFCASLADVFEDRAELIPWRNDLFALIDQTPDLNWLLLTKRPENIKPYLREVLNEASFPPNVRFGTSVENQEQANKRIPHLLDTHADGLFLSMEPLLGPVDLRHFEYPYEKNTPGLTAGKDWLTGEEWQHSGIFGGGNSMLDKDDIDEYKEPRIHWVILGGESGDHARPMEKQWALDIQAQCQKTGTPFFFKQGSQANWPDFKNRETYGDLDSSEFPSTLPSTKN